MNTFHRIARIVFKTIVYALAALGVVLIALAIFAWWFLSGPLGIEPYLDYEGELAATHLGVLEGGFPSQPQWTPDGGHLVFNRGRDIYVVDSAGSRLKLVAGGNDETPAYFPDVSPAGDRIAYIAYEHSADWWFPWNKDHDWEIVFVHHRRFLTAAA